MIENRREKNYTFLGISQESQKKKQKKSKNLSKKNMRNLLDWRMNPSNWKNLPSAKYSKWAGGGRGWWGDLEGSERTKFHNGTDKN